MKIKSFTFYYLRLKSLMISYKFRNKWLFATYNVNLKALKGQLLTRNILLRFLESKISNWSVIWKYLEIVEISSYNYVRVLKFGVCFWCEFEWLIQANCQSSIYLHWLSSLISNKNLSHNLHSLESICLSHNLLSFWIWETKR